MDGATENLEEIAYLQEMREIHINNVRKLRKQEAIRHDFSLALQNMIEQEEKQLAVVELKLITFELLKEISTDQESPYIVSKQTLLNFLQVQSKTVSFMEKLADTTVNLADNDGRLIGTINEIGHTPYDLEKQIRLEILFIFILAIGVQIYSESILITLTFLLVIWSLIYIIYYLCIYHTTSSMKR